MVKHTTRIFYKYSIASYSGIIDNLQLKSVYDVINAWAWITSIQNKMKRKTMIELISVNKFKKNQHLKSFSAI